MLAIAEARIRQRHPALQVRALGWEPIVAPHAHARSGYFAGDDATRLGDLVTAITDPAIDGIWCVRGGYGAMRLLPDIDFDQRPASEGHVDAAIAAAAIMAFEESQNVQLPQEGPSRWRDAARKEGVSRL